MEEILRNLFGPSVDEDILIKLSEVGQEIVSPEGTILRNNFKDPLIVCSGTILVKAFGRPNTVYTPGDMALNPSFSSKEKKVRAMSDADIARYFANQTQQCITDVHVIVFPNDCVLGMLDNVSFVRWLMENQSMLMFQMTCYQTFLYHDDAYQAVRYVLKLAKAYGLHSLTHMQIALLSGRNRVTMTKILHEIALAEPELFEEQSQW